MTRPYRNRRDRRKPPQGLQTIPEIALLGAEITNWNAGTLTATVTFDAAVIKTGPVVLWHLANGGSITIVTNGVIAANGLSATFVLPAEPDEGDWLVFPGSQPSLLGGANWQVGLAISYFPIS